MWLNSFSVVLGPWHLLRPFKIYLPCLQVVKSPSDPLNQSSSCYSETVPTQRLRIQLALHQVDSKASRNFWQRAVQAEHQTGAPVYLMKVQKQCILSQ